tara:strand:- start:981 stop:1721 length:741 start_codon:yes stop_codon:yes gene_type:complete
MAIPSRKWRRLHRWLGLLIVAPVIILSFTGILLNHVESLGLHQRTLPSFLANIYGVPAAEPVVSVEIGQRWWSFVGNQLFLQAQAVSQCPRPYAGVVSVADIYVAGCDGALLLLDNNGTVIERLGSEFELPPFERLTSVPSSGAEEGSSLVLFSPASSWLYDIDQLSATPFDEVVQPLAWRMPPAEVVAALPTQVVPPELNWQRLIQDIHSGRVVSLAGKLLMDAAALLLIVLAITGVIIWSRTRP